MTLESEEIPPRTAFRKGLNLELANCVLLVAGLILWIHSYWNIARPIHWLDHDCFQITIAELSSWTNAPWPKRPPCLLSDLFRKKLLILGVDGWSRREQIQPVCPRSKRARRAVMKLIIRFSPDHQFHVSARVDSCNSNCFPCSLNLFSCTIGL